MDNHIHLIWQALHGYTLNGLQTSFKKYTSTQFTKLCSADKHITQYEVGLADRKHHFWKRSLLGVELYTELVFIKKLNYIHQNPVQAGLCLYAEDYKYSSAMFYTNGIDKFNFLAHYKN